MPESAAETRKPTAAEISKAATLLARIAGSTKTSKKTASSRRNIKIAQAASRKAAAERRADKHQNR